MSFLFWRRKRDQELDDEIESHLRMAARERVECGESSAQAEISARREMGNVGLVKEVTRDVWGWRWIGDVAQDVRYGLRMLRKSPGFTAVAVLTLALGIGANAAIFSILDPLLLRKLPVQNPDELVLVHAAGTINSEDFSEPPAYFIYRDNNSVFSGVAASAKANSSPATRYGQDTFSVTLGGQTATVDGRMVSGNYFNVLGVRPFRGRLLMESDSQSAFGDPVAVLSFDYWRSAFNGDDSAIGRTILIHNSPYTIVGVTPPEFFGVQVGSIPNIYLPFGSDPKSVNAG